MASSTQATHDEEQLDTQDLDQQYPEEARITYKLDMSGGSFFQTGNIGNEFTEAVSVFVPSFLGNLIVKGTTLPKCNFAQSNSKWSRSILFQKRNNIRFISLSKILTCVKCNI